MMVRAVLRVTASARRTGITSIRRNVVVLVKRRDADLLQLQVSSMPPRFVIGWVRRCTRRGALVLMLMKIRKFEIPFFQNEQ